MPRHPRYGLVCLFAIALLAWSNLRGWDPFAFIAAAAAGEAFGGAFAHK